MTSEEIRNQTIKCRINAPSHCKLGPEGSQRVVNWVCRGRKLGSVGCFKAPSTVQ